MALVRGALLLLAVLLIVPAWVSVHAQSCSEVVCPDGRTVPCPNSSPSPEEMSAACGGSNQGPSGGGYSGPSAADIEAERERQEEAAREAQRQAEAERQRRAEEERRRAEEEKRRQEEEFRRSRDQAAGTLKGTSNSSTTLKGENTAPFGLKGTSAAEASSVIKTSSPDRDVRNIPTAWQQIHCAAEITRSALERAELFEHGQGSQADMDEIRYLASEAGNALAGQRLGVQCSAAPAVKFVKTPDAHALQPRYQRVLTTTVNSAQALYDAQQKSTAAQKKFDEARAKLQQVKEQQPQLKSPMKPPAAPAKPAGSDQDAIQRAAAEQQEYRKRERERINEVYAKQKELEKERLDALALLRQAQAELNRANAQKVLPAAQLSQAKRENDLIEKGQLPPELSRRPQ